MKAKQLSVDNSETIESVRGHWTQADFDRNSEFEHNLETHNSELDKNLSKVELT